MCSLQGKLIAIFFIPFWVFPLFHFVWVFCPPLCGSCWRDMGLPHAICHSALHPGHPLSDTPGVPPSGLGRSSLQECNLGGVTLVRRGAVPRPRLPHRRCSPSTNLGNTMHPAQGGRPLAGEGTRWLAPAWLRTESPPTATGVSRGGCKERTAAGKPPQPGRSKQRGSNGAGNHHPRMSALPFGR